MQANLWNLTTSSGNIITANCIVIASGAGSFVPRRPPLENIQAFEYKSIEQLNRLIETIKKYY